MDLLKSPIQKLYRNFLVPSLLSAVVTSIYSFVDMIAIGRGVGPEGTAAISIATPFHGIISFFGILCGVGGSVYLGKARGEGATEKSNAYFFSVAFSCSCCDHFCMGGIYRLFNPHLSIFWRYGKSDCPMCRNTRIVLSGQCHFLFCRRTSRTL